jgi:hypothetical protein
MIVALTLTIGVKPTIAPRVRDSRARGSLRAPIDARRSPAPSCPNDPLTRGIAGGVLPFITMPTARAPRPTWPELIGGLVEALRTPRDAADELDEARELLAYWEQRARRLPRWALVRRREAREMARRWRERVRSAEQIRYGRGVLGAVSMLAVERRLPAALAHGGRRAARLALYATVCVTVTFVLVLALAVAVVVGAV